MVAAPQATRQGSAGAALISSVLEQLDHGMGRLAFSIQGPTVRLREGPAYPILPCSVGQVNLSRTCVTSKTARSGASPSQRCSSKERGRERTKKLHPGTLEERTPSSGRLTPSLG